MCKGTYDLVDRILLSGQFQNPESVVSYVIQNAGFDIITNEDKMWILKQAQIQISSGYTIKLFQGDLNETKFIDQ